MNAPSIVGAIAVVLLCVAAWLRARYLVCETFNPIERGYWLKSFQTISVPKMTTPNGLARPAEHLRFMRKKAREFRISEAEIGMTFHELLGHAVMRQREVMETSVVVGTSVVMGDALALTEHERREYEKLNAEWLLANNINPAMCPRFDIPSRPVTSS